MKKTLKSNKGFSLVELIVVVLIMAIIAVALAPQVMKWVGHSRTSTDASTYDTLYENIQLALADENALKEVKGSKITFTMADDGVTVSSFPAGNVFKNKMDDVCGSGWETKVKKKDASAANDYVVTVDYSGTTLQVERTTEPESDNVKQ